MNTRGRLLVIGLPVALLLALPSCSPARSAAGQNLEPAQPQGAVILQRACTLCHNLSGLGAYADSWGTDEWRSMVETMVSYGAVLTPGEVETVARYLGVNFGVDGPEAEAPPPQPDTTSEAASLLQSACTTCHDLEGITQNPGTYSAAEYRATIQRMQGYGAAVDASQVDMLVDYLVATYGG